MQYCRKESEYQCLSRATLFKILKVCVASQKRNMHGLDNITSEGIKTVDVLQRLISKLQVFGLSQEVSACLESLLVHVNQHLQFEMKSHIGSKSLCADHCSIYSLSDPKCDEFRSAYSHKHDQHCDECSATCKLDTALIEAFKSVSHLIPSDIQDEIKDDIQVSKANISACKAHCVRTVHQEQAMQAILTQLNPQQALIIMDWAMKFLPIKHRETQAYFLERMVLVCMLQQ